MFRLKFTFNTVLVFFYEHLSISFVNLVLSNFWKKSAVQKWRLAQYIAPVKKLYHADRTLCAKLSHWKVIFRGKVIPMQNWHYAK